MVQAHFPAGLQAWTDKRDEIDIDWANDINSVAAEIGSTEAILGVNPHIEKNPLGGGPPRVYATVDARISAMQQPPPAPPKGPTTQIFPSCQLTFDEIFIPNRCGAAPSFSQYNQYVASFDPFKMYNGVDITIPQTGWYVVTASQYWDWWSTGYHGHYFWCNGIYRRHHHWFWDFPGNCRGPGGYWYGWLDAPVYREAMTHTMWQGVLNAGDRLRTSSENGCPHTPHRTFNGSMEVSFMHVPVSQQVAGV